MSIGSSAGAGFTVVRAVCSGRVFIGLGGAGLEAARQAGEQAAFFLRFRLADGQWRQSAVAGILGSRADETCA